MYTNQSSFLPFHACYISAILQMMAAEVEEGAVACEADDDEDDGCMQRRLLQNAHLDYIYTQHKGKP
jgi:hypothetical protein